MKNPSGKSEWQVVGAELSPQMQHKLEQEGRQSEGDVILANTMSLARALHADTPPPPEHYEQWQRQIAAGEVDVNAKLEVRCDGTEISAYDRLFHYLLMYSDAGEEVLPLYTDILNHTAELNYVIAPPDDGRHPVLERVIWSPNAPFLDAYLSHPRVDVNQKISNGNWCKTAVDVCLTANHGQHPYINEQEGKHYTNLLLERGAILGYCGEEPHRLGGFEFLEPAIRRWMQDWRAFQQGTLKPDQLTATQLGHFYSLGHLQDALDPDCWSRHEAHALTLYDDLPEWVKEDSPCLERRQELAACLKPEPLVAGWSVEMQASPNVMRGRS